MVSQARYDPACFNVRNISEAKSIILTPEDSSTEERWEKETPYLGQMIVDHLGIIPQHRVLDYGCGIGRLSKELIKRAGCPMIGVDTSVSMRALAHSYVVDDRFLACSPNALSSVQDVHFAIAVWVLQHIPDLNGALDAIVGQLRSFGKLFVVNTRTRFIPIDNGRWADDGQDVREQLGARLKEIDHGMLDVAHASKASQSHAFWAVYQKRT